MRFCQSGFVDMSWWYSARIFCSGSFGWWMTLEGECHNVAAADEDE